jgi:hypothetical protein
MAARPIATTFAPKPSTSPPPSPSIDPRGFALLKESSALPSNPFDEDPDLDGKTDVERIIDALDARAAKKAAQQEEWHLKVAAAEASATAKATPGAVSAVPVVTASTSKPERRRDRRRRQRRARQLKARQAG